MVDLAAISLAQAIENLSAVHGCEWPRALLFALASRCRTHALHACEACDHRAVSDWPRVVRNAVKASAVRP